MGKFSEILIKHEPLQNRIRHSREFLADVRGALSKLKSGVSYDVCIFVAGSLGRLEAGRKSDLDVFLLSHRENRSVGERSLSRLEEIEIFSDLIKLNEKLMLPEFSGDGRFLKVHEVDDLIRATGDSMDDSENLFTTRLLLLLESKALSNDILYGTALERVLENYFRDGKGRRDFQPLFLLNDILRYWRTLCLNYERDRTHQKPWWKKNLNLKFSRKLTVFSTVLAIVAKHVTSTEQFKTFSNMVPLERLATTLDRMSDDTLLGGFAALLDDYEQFLASKSFAELETKDPGKIDALRTRAEVFGDFFLAALDSASIEKRLARYVVI